MLAALISLFVGTGDYFLTLFQRQYPQLASTKVVSTGGSAYVM